jgi:uncharacterized protein YndB with AHSA1/START domain
LLSRPYIWSGRSSVRGNMQLGAARPYLGSVARCAKQQNWMVLMPLALPEEHRPAGSAISVVRDVGASPARVWKAFTDPERLVEWWAPKGYVAITDGWKFFRGGAWHFRIRLPNGRVRSGVIQFDGIHPLRGLSFESYGDGPLNMDVPIYTTLNFDDIGVGTRVTMTMSLTSSAQNLGERLPSGLQDAAEQALGRLAELLEGDLYGIDRQADDPTFLCVDIHVAAPRDVVWSAWTDAASLSHWWCPAGVTLTSQRYDLRLRRTWDLALRTADGVEQAHQVAFQEVDRPGSLVYVHYVDGRPLSYTRIILQEPEGEAGRRTRIILRRTSGNIDPEDTGTLPRAREAEEFLSRWAAFFRHGANPPPRSRNSSSDRGGDGAAYVSLRITVGRHRPVGRVRLRRGDAVETKRSLTPRQLRQGRASRRMRSAGSSPAGRQPHQGESCRLISDYVRGSRH